MNATATSDLPGFSLSPMQQAVLEVASRFGREQIAPFVREYDREERFPHEIYEQMGPLGLTGGVVPEQYGGAGLDYVTYALLIMELARYCQAMAAAATWSSGVAGSSLLKYGSEAQKAKYLVPLAEGRGPIAFALTEEHTGSDVASMRTRITRDGDGYRINGCKIWISMIGSCKWILAFGTIDPAAGRKGICSFVVEPDWPGLIRRPFKNKLAFRCMETGELVFDNVYVPAENLVGVEGQGFEIAMCSVENGRLGVASRCVGIMRACLEDSISYAKNRITFGQQIGQRQLVQSKITDMVVAYHSSRLLTLQLAQMRDTGERAREFGSMAKMHASDSAMRTAEAAMQIHGAYGFSDEYNVGRHFRDAKVMQVIEGSNDIHRALIAEYALGYRR